MTSLWLEARRREELVAWRRDFHQHPELGFEEERSASAIEARLRESGLSPRRMAGTGVVAVIEGGRPGPTLMLRADMDALRVEEATGAPYASKHPGLMHACGHDGHMAILLMAARLLAERAHDLAGRVKVVFQPAEEGLGGAQRMVREGVLEDPCVDACLGLHLWNRLPCGVVAASAGAIMAAVDRFVATVRGRGGHGAMPHEGLDAIAVAAHVVTGLQTLFTRTFSPLTPTVLTVGRIAGGTSFNVLADSVELEGTVRTFDPKVHEVLPGAVERCVTAIASSFGAEADVFYERHCPVTANDPGMADFVRGIAEEVVGPESTFIQEKTMGGEDISFYLRERPGCFFFLGSANPGEGKDARHHNPRFDIDERALEIGVEIFVRAARAYLA